MNQYYIQITNKCNLTCTHCIRGETSEDEMNLEQFKLTIDKIQSFDKNPKKIIITGGEPTLVRDLENMIDYVINKNSIVFLMTNGVNLPAFLLKYKKNQNFCLQISLDGENEDNDKIRGKNTFLNVKKSLEWLVENEFTYYISSAVNKENKDSILRLSQILYKLKPETWHVSSVMPFGRASNDNIFTTNEWNEFVDDLISITAVRLDISKMFVFSANKNVCTTNCGCLTSKFYVLPNLNLIPCTCLRNIVLTNLSQHDFESFYESEFYLEFNKFEIPSESKCKTCDHLLQCKTGCLGMSLKYYGKLFMGDKRCLKI